MNVIFSAGHPAVAWTFVVMAVGLGFLSWTGWPDRWRNALAARILRCWYAATRPRRRAHARHRREWRAAA
jgi:hypothetical protein